jgi:hypothetical protein
MRVLVLVISDDSLPHYAQNREAIRECIFNTHPDFDCYFVENDPNVDVSGLSSERRDTFVSKSENGFGAPIIQKTVEAIAFFTKDTAYDFVLRTNLSSFWVFSHLAPVMYTLPKTGCLHGPIGDDWGKSFVSGAGMLMSIDVAQYVCKSWTQHECGPDDDVTISHIASAGGIQFIPGVRLDLRDGHASVSSDWFMKYESYHYRIKCLDSTRRHEEADMMRKLHQMHKTLNTRSLATVFVVTKNEYDLIEDFIRYHAHLFGYENVVVIDNGSTHPRVLDVYARYGKKGVRVVYTTGYEGGSQGEHFTRFMNEYKDKTEFVIGLDTDLFFTVNESCDHRIIRQYLRDLPKDHDTFRMNRFFMSVVNTQSKNYVNYALAVPTQSTEFVVRNGYNGQPYVQHQFYRAANFISTAPGNHSGVTTTNRVFNCPNVTYVHFHDTGKRRHTERCLEILNSYKYIDSTTQSEMDQLIALVNNQSSNGYHRKNQYIAFLRKKLTLIHYGASGRDLERQVYEEDAVPSDVFVWEKLKQLLSIIA